ncbi:MAG: 4-(cytidine 5'-diphospho)-2-C-methyl-D-erythritol kinase [Firmicutes bacterium]|nr:4-(cytidine 5'-diphospho)-2-C-methyl-D-erythritol kinase [Candidatus Colimorpha enterica]
MTESVKVKAPAKINLFLEILGKRDDGYHNVDLIMQTVSLFDTVEVSKSDGIGLECNVKALENGSNLCVRAAKAFFERFGIKGGCFIKLRKVIPSGAGLGGGSSDAAAVLKALNVLYGVDSHEEELEKIASSLGSDVPFLVRGGTARAVGTGTELIHLSPLPSFHCLIAEGKKKAPTAEAYRAADGIRDENRRTADAMIRAIEKKDTERVWREVFNRFSCLYENDERVGIMKKNGALCAQISGSGSSVFGIYADENSLKNAEKEIASRGFDTYTCKTINDFN